MTRARTLAVLVAAAVAATVAVVPAPAEADPVRSPRCLWGRPTDPNVINVAYPDEGATYWGARIAIPPGGELILRGRYAHARYLSFNTYNEQAAPVDALADVEIEPDPGSTNPFVSGADRTAPARNYTVRVVAGVPPAPADRPANTLYQSVAGQASPLSSSILYRVYVPDAGRDLTGDVGLPRAELRSPDGTIVDLTAACTDADAVRPIGSEAGGLPVHEAARDGALPGVAGTEVPASDPPRWEKFFNLQHIQSVNYLGETPARPVLDDTLASGGGGYLSNRHNDYVVALANRGFGPVLALRFRAASVPATQAADPVMGGGQLRYWSMCTNERHSTRYVDCVIDEDVPVGTDGFVTVVVSAPEHRPANATADCGVAWLAWGTSPETMLILRHMLPDPGFAQAIQRVDRPADLAAVMGDYLPAGRYSDRAGFEALGCT